MKHRIMGVSLALALAACSGEAEDAGEQAATLADSKAPQASASELANEPSGENGPDADGLPARFTGVWDAETGTCGRESDLRLEISPEQIIFYETLGTIRSVAQIDENTVELDLAMEGEGEAWDETYRLSLADDGAQLNTSYPYQAAAGAPVPRKKCL